MLPFSRENFRIKLKKGGGLLRRVPFGGVLQNRFPFFSCRHDPKLSSPDVRSKAARLILAGKLTQEHTMVKFAYRPLRDLFRRFQAVRLRKRGMSRLLVRKVTVGVNDLR